MTTIIRKIVNLFRKPEVDDPRLEHGASCSAIAAAILLAACQEIDRDHPKMVPFLGISCEHG